jgi:hypothetical protein
MKAGSRPQYYRIRRMVQMVREGSGCGEPPNCSDFMAEFGVSRRTVARDLDFLRDEEHAPLTYDDARHGFRLTDETYTLPPVTITRREAFSFGLARKLLAHYEGTPLHLDMRSGLSWTRSPNRWLAMSPLSPTGSVNMLGSCRRIMCEFLPMEIT